MFIKKSRIFILLGFLVFVIGCSLAGVGGFGVQQSPNPLAPSAAIPSAPTGEQPPSGLPANATPAVPTPSQTPTPSPAPSSTASPTPTETEVSFEVGREITIDYLRSLEITGSEITFEQQLANGANYYQYIASYLSEGNRIYGLLTIPFGEPPQGGFKAIVFNHGYIPPTIYRTTERYVAYVNYLARSGFVVFKIDYRGHGQSQGEPSGSYFSPGYTIDFDRSP